MIAPDSFPAWAMLGVTIFGAGCVWVGRITKGESEAKNAASAADAAHTVAKEAHARLDDLVQRFGDFKEHVAREYVPNAAIIRLEERMGKEFREVRDWLERRLPKDSV